jgi:diguanylate cyclase (GGDEF)-like protein
MTGKLESLSRSFADRLQGRYEELEAALTRFETERSPESLEALRLLAHNLGGSSGGYGFHEVGELSRKLELAASSGVEHAVAHVPGPRRLVGALRRAVQEAALKSAPSSPTLPAFEDSEPRRRLVYLIEDDADLAALLTEQLAPYGYDVAHHTTEESVLESLDESPPSVMMVDVNLGDGLRGGAIVQSLPPAVRERVPVVFISVDGGMGARLEAVRAGADAYLTKPLDVDDLSSILDHLVRDTSFKQLRVLVVDDTLEDAQLHAATLEEAGMVTRVATDPSLALGLVREFDPEVVLLDLYMPHVRGDELASIIRQHPSLISLPIVLLSAETDQRLQFDAMKRGADDFLSKPVDPSRLASSVRVRGQRYRQLRMAMQRDSLTGLLNHRNAKQALATERARALRTGSPLSVAMLDIDYFKRVNDTHGHPAGDRVIRSLARVLVQRLRRSDIVGRYGGEEFLVIMPDTSVASAVGVLEELRASFSRLTHVGDDGKFSCTMSGGLVQLDPDEASDEVLARADRALYDAKRKGRDRIVGEA